MAPGRSESDLHSAEIMALATKAEELIDLSQLRAPGGPCRIAQTADRAITLAQLDQLQLYVRRHCVEQGWSSSHRMEQGALDPETINLYDVVFWVVKPATVEDDCSYVELVAAGPQAPTWFVSHWWGETLNSSWRCLRQHSRDRELPDSAAYWICAYANNQWCASDEVGNEPAQSSFRKAMGKAMGTVTVLDREAVTYSRVWCAYEIFISLFAEQADAGREYKYDIYTAVGRRDAVGLTDGFAAVDVNWRGDCDSAKKLVREGGFPIALATQALSTAVQTAQATRQADRRKILNEIAGAANLDAPPPLSHSRYEVVNRLLRGRFAAGALALASATDDLRQRLGEALRESGLKNLQLFIAQEHFSLMLRSLPTESLSQLDLNFMHQQIGDEGLTSIAQEICKMRHLTSLHLQLEANNVGQDGLQALSDALCKAQQLTHLSLKLDLNPLGRSGLVAISAALRSLPALNTLELRLENCGLGSKLRIRRSAASRRLLLTSYLCPGSYKPSAPKHSEASAIQALVSALTKARKLTDLTLNLGSNGLGADGAEELGKGLSQVRLLDKLKLYLSENNINAEGATALVGQLAQGSRLSELILHLGANGLVAADRESIEAQLADVKRRDSAVVKLFGLPGGHANSGSGPGCARASS